MKKMIRLSKSCLSDAEKKAVLEVLDKEFLGMGLEVQQLEKGLSEFFSRPAVCVVNGTAALHLALQACGIGPGDEVIVPSLTYVASFQAISATGAKPVACDVLEDSLTLDWRDAEKRITHRTKALMPVHYSGGVGDLEEIYELAKRHQIRVIEDAAHAFGTVHRGKRIGGFGDIVCFSFDGIKTITSGEGGCIVTEDELVLQKMRDARLLGVEKDSEKRFSGARSWEFEVNSQGWRYHMSNIMAAIGIEQLKRFNELAIRRKMLAQHYDSLLATHAPQFRKINHNYDFVVPHIYVIKLDKFLDRDLIRQKMLESGIQTGIHYQPNHWLRYYGDKQENLSVTDAVYPKLLTLPLHPGLTEQDVEYVCEVLIACTK